MLAKRVLFSLGLALLDTGHTEWCRWTCQCFGPSVLPLSSDGIAAWVSHCRTQRWLWEPPRCRHTLLKLPQSAEDISSFVRCSKNRFRFVKGVNLKTFARSWRAPCTAIANSNHTPCSVYIIPSTHDGNSNRRQLSSQTTRCTHKNKRNAIKNGAIVWYGTRLKSNRIRWQQRLHRDTIRLWEDIVCDAYEASLHYTHISSLTSYSYTHCAQPVLVEWSSRSQCNICVQRE